MPHSQRRRGLTAAPWLPSPPLPLSWWPLEAAAAAALRLPPLLAVCAALLTVLPPSEKVVVVRLPGLLEARLPAACALPLACTATGCRAVADLAFGLGVPSAAACGAWPRQLRQPPTAHRQDSHSQLGSRF